MVTETHAVRNARFRLIHISKPRAVWFPATRLARKLTELGFHVTLADRTVA